MIDTISFQIKALQDMKKYPEKLFYIGNHHLLDKKKIAMVGSRRPNLYTRAMTHELAQKLSDKNVCIVSGAAMGVDAIAHKGAGSSNTIAVVANGLDIRYPAINKKLIEEIELKGLLLSPFNPHEKARAYTFVLRNEIVVALGDILIVTEANRNSGSLRSVEYALKMGKKIYTLPHRLNESLGTQDLIKNRKAEVIYDVDDFIQSLGFIQINSVEDEVLKFCKKHPTYDEAVLQYGETIFEYELLGKIRVDNGRIRVC